MTHDMRIKMAKAADRLDATTKPIRNLAWLTALAVGVWVQFLGPGLVTILREASGSNHLATAMQQGFKETQVRLEFIEDNMAPPKIVNWIDDRPIGLCNEDACRKMHSISRTEYGKGCGMPEVSIELRLANGEKYPMQSKYIPIEASTVIDRIIHNFVMEDFVPSGVHSYQFTLLYPSCEWAREPILRHSPWFELVVTRS